MWFACRRNSPCKCPEAGLFAIVKEEQGSRCGYSRVREGEREMSGIVKLYRPNRLDSI